MLTLAPTTWFASPASPVSVVVVSQSPLAGSDRAVRVLTLAIIAVLIVLALRTVGHAVQPIVQVARTIVAASMVTVLLLAAVVLVLVVAVGSV